MIPQFMKTMWVVSASLQWLDVDYVLQFLDFSTFKKQQMAEKVNLIQGKN